MVIENSIQKSSQDEFKKDQSIAKSLAITSGLAIVGSYLPFLLDYLLYSFWNLRPDPHEVLASGFLWMMLVISGLIVHIALGVKAVAMCLMLNLEAADVPFDRWSRWIALVTTLVCFEALVLLMGIYVRILPGSITVVTPLQYGIFAICAAILAYVTYWLIRSVRHRANRRRSATM